MRQQQAQRSGLDILFRKFTYLLFFIFVFFPYIQFYDIGSDSQPYSLVLSILIFFLIKKKLSFPEALLLIVFLSSILIFFASEMNFGSIRSLFNYASLFFLSYVTSRVLISKRINFEIFLKSSIGVWSIVGFIQALYKRDFLNLIISNTRTTQMRGVTGLAPEPSSYGIVFIFFILFLLHTKYKHRNIYIFTCLVGVFFTAESALALLVLAMLLFIYLLTHLSIKSALVSVIAGVTALFLIDEFMVKTRLYVLTSKLSQEGYLLYMNDASIHDRLFHVLFSLKGFFENFLFPNGFSAWKEYVYEQVKTSVDSEWINPAWISVGDRIMSGFGGAFFELGFLALLIPLSLAILLFRLYSHDLKKFFFFFLALNSLMWNAIPIGFSFFAFYLGFLSYLVWIKKCRVDHGGT